MGSIGDDCCWVDGLVETFLCDLAAATCVFVFGSTSIASTGEAQLCPAFARGRYLTSTVGATDPTTFASNRVTECSGTSSDPVCIRALRSRRVFRRIGRAFQPCGTKAAARGLRVALGSSALLESLRGARSVPFVGLTVRPSLFVARLVSVVGRKDNGLYPSAMVQIAENGLRCTAQESAET